MDMKAIEAALDEALQRRGIRGWEYKILEKWERALEHPTPELVGQLFNDHFGSVVLARLILKAAPVVAAQEAVSVTDSPHQAEPRAPRVPRRDPGPRMGSGMKGTDRE
jgi:hypothetical protein